VANVAVELTGAKLLPGTLPSNLIQKEDQMAPGSRDLAKATALLARRSLICKVEARRTYRPHAASTRCGNRSARRE
jgi:hypothetical protein